ncbi:hypothetical protein DFH09DRAFT_1083462 [Mycena vulgaris]|nr:hypothetical protein DFH09DRAFT_1083462 [Mycena vulgaris]
MSPSMRVCVAPYPNWDAIDIYYELTGFSRSPALCQDSKGQPSHVQYYSLERNHPSRLYTRYDHPVVNVVSKLESRAEAEVIQAENEALGIAARQSSEQGVRDNHQVNAATADGLVVRGFQVLQCGQHSMARDWRSCDSVMWMSYKHRERGQGKEIGMGPHDGEVWVFPRVEFECFEVGRYQAGRVCLAPSVAHLLGPRVHQRLLNGAATSPFTWRSDTVRAARRTNGIPHAFWR